MSLTIDLSKDTEATLAARARAANVPTEQYLAQIVEDALQRRKAGAAARLDACLDDLAQSVEPGTSPDEMSQALEEALAAVRPARRWAK